MKKILSLLILVSPLLVAQDRVMTPKDVARIKTVGDAQLSPDGENIAYTLNVPRKLFEEENGTAWTELHVWDKTNLSRPFITGQVHVGSVAWTPDGKGISFLAKRGDDKTKSLYVIPLNGGEARKVLEHETDIAQYAWNGDSKSVVFRAKEEKDEETEKNKDMGFNQEIYEEGLLQIKAWVADLSGEEVKKRMLDLEGTVFDLVVSPDGHQAALAIAPTSLVDDSYMKKRIRIVNLADGKIATKLDNPGKLGKMRWSPDGKYLAAISGADINDPKEGRLFVYDAKTAALNKHLMDAKGHVRSISWRDSETIHYLWDEGVEVELRTLKIKNEKTDAELDSDPTFPALSYSKASSRMALVGDTPTHPNEVFLWEEGSDTVQRVTHSNPWLEEVQLAPSEVVNFKARDGLDLQGILIRPLNEEKGKRYPLILTVHGGPEAHYRNGWLTNYSSLGQVAASRGFAVFYVNYRASTGRGVDFSKLDHGRPAMEEFDDLVDAVQHLTKNMGLVDEKRVGVTGGSYGGYATAWCSTALSEHFAAGVMFVGISNKISKIGVSDIPEEVYLVHDRHRLWDNWQLFLEQSPIYHVQKAQTPLLIMHGKDDPRVPPSQSMELFRHLKTLGKVPVRLVNYPGEGHGNRKAGARYDYNLRALRWFEHYLQGEGGEKPPYKLDYGQEKEEEASAKAN